MTMLARSLVFAAALALAAPASALTLGFSSDADFNANAGLTKDFGGNVRWGDAGPAGDWEYSVVDGSDVPLPGGNPLQYAWNPGPDMNPHEVTFGYDDGAGTTDLALSIAGAVSSGSPAVGGDGVNALAVRARADLGDAADLSDIVVSFDVGGSVNLGSLVGDADAEYVMLIDARLSDGFTLTADVELMDGNGSIPQYGFKVGNVVPEPGTVWLLGAGALGLVARRRR